MTIGDNIMLQVKYYTKEECPFSVDGYPKETYPHNDGDAIRDGFQLISDADMAIIKANFADIVNNYRGKQLLASLKEERIKEIISRNELLRENGYEFQGYSFTTSQEQLINMIGILTLSNEGLVQFPISLVPDKVGRLFRHENKMHFLQHIGTAFARMKQIGEEYSTIYERVFNAVTLEELQGIIDDRT